MHSAPNAVCSHRSPLRWPDGTRTLRRPLHCQPLPAGLVASCSLPVTLQSIGAFLPHKDTGISAKPSMVTAQLLPPRVLLLPWGMGVATPYSCPLLLFWDSLTHLRSRLWAFPAGTFYIPLLVTLSLFPLSSCSPVNLWYCVLWGSAKPPPTNILSRLFHFLWDTGSVLAWSPLSHFLFLWLFSCSCRDASLSFSSSQLCNCSFSVSFAHFFPSFHSLFFYLF